MSRNSFLTSLLALALGACNNLGLGGEPEELRLEVDAVGAAQVVLVTSSDWVFVEDPACETQNQGCPEVLRVNAADTTVVSVPLGRTFRFTDTYRYLIEIYPAGDVPATVSMRVEIDGKEWYDDSRELSPTGDGGEQAKLEFVYRWQEPRIR